MAKERRQAAVTFYNDILREVKEAYTDGKDKLRLQIEE